jgi:hypothetical protein
VCRELLNRCRAGVRRKLYRPAREVVLQVSGTSRVLRCSKDGHSPVGNRTDREHSDCQQLHDCLEPAVSSLAICRRRDR